MEFRFERTGQKIFEPVIAIDPLTAYQKFVIPHMAGDDWIEKRAHVADTNLMPREWLGLALHGLTIALMTESQKWIGQAEFSDSDGVILEMPSKGQRRTGGYFVEQVLATHRARHGSVEDTVRAAIDKKSIKKGEQYAANRDLVVLVNKSGDAELDALAGLVAKSNFKYVDVCNYDTEAAEFICRVFSRTDGYVCATHFPQSFMEGKTDAAPPRRRTF